jgi:hypothetical protein
VPVASSATTTTGKLGPSGLPRFGLAQCVGLLAVLSSVISRKRC